MARVTAPRPTEAECQATIIEAAMRFGWRVHAERHARVGDRWVTAIQGHAGFPDLILIHPTRGLVVVELKRKPNKVEPGQQAWLDAFAARGIRAEVWWVPEDLDACIRWLADPRKPA